MVPDIGSTMDADALLEGNEKALVVRLREDEVHLDEDGSGLSDVLPINPQWQIAGSPISEVAFDKVIIYQVNADEDENAVYVAAFQDLLTEGGEYGFRIQFGQRDFKGETTSTWFHFAGMHKDHPVRVFPPPDTEE